MLLLSVTGIAEAAVCTSLSAGTWNTATRWSCGHVPGTTPATQVDTVVIAHNITQNANPTIAGLTINAGGTLTDTAGNDLVVTGNLTNNGTITSTNQGQIGVTGAASVISGSGGFSGSVRLFTSGTAVSVAAGSNLSFSGTAQIRTGRTVGGTTVAGSVLTINGTLNASGQTGGTGTPFIRSYASSTIVSSTGVITTAATGTIQYRATGTITNNGTVTVGNITRNTGTGTWTNAANSNLTVLTSYAAASMVLNASATGNTVTYTTPAVPKTPSGNTYYNLAGTGVTCPHGFTVLGTSPCPAGMGSVISFPTSCTSGGGTGTIAWTAPANAYANDNVLYATASLNVGQTTQYLNCTGFNFSAIPAGSTITGITVYVDRKASRATRIRDAFVYMIKGGVVSTAFNGKTATAYTTADVEEAHGGAGNLWGTTWTQTDVTAANFGVAFASNYYSTTAGPRTASVDSIRVKVDYASTSIDHVTVSAPNLGSTCSPTSVTIGAHTTTHAAPSSAVGTIRLTTSDSKGDWSVVTGIGTLTNGTANDGLATYAFGVGETSVTLGLSHTTAGVITVGVADNTSGASLTATTPPAELANSITYSAGGFTITDSAGVAITSMTQVSGTASPTYYLKATSAACGIAFNNVVRSIDMAFECVDPTTCQTPVVSITNVTTGVATNLKTGVPFGTDPATLAAASWQAVSLNFNASSLAPFKLNYPDAGNISLYFRYTPSSLLSESTPFVVKPAGFVVSNIKRTSDNFANPAAANAGGTAFVKAGQAFTATVTALTSSGKTKADAGTAISCVTTPADCTPNYGKEVAAEKVKLTPALVAGLGLSNIPPLVCADEVTNCDTTSAPPSKIPLFGAFASGTATGSNFAWDEVGIITLTASVGDADYLGVGDVTGTTSSNVGRFTLGKFALSNVVIDDRADLCQGGFLVSDGVTACASAFTYMGEEIDASFTLLPQSLHGAAVLNYVDSATAANDFAKLDPTTFANLNMAAVDTATAGGPHYLSARIVNTAMPVVTCASTPCFQAASADVTVPFTFSRGATDGPYTAVNFGVAITDSDGARAEGAGAPAGLCNNPNAADCYDLDTDATAGNDRAQLGTTEFRYGRSKVSNAFGSELLPLWMNVRLDYWNGTYYTPNVDDDLSVVNAAFVGGSYTGNLSAGETALTAPTFVNGEGQIGLSAPGAGNGGSVGVTLNPPAYLPGDTARATFGLFKGKNEFIYLREAY
jgi:MSHA biogenesis protein MshQ